MGLSVNDKQFGITRQGVLQWLRQKDEKIDSSLREMAMASRIQIGRIDMKREVLSGRTVPLRTAAFIFISAKHGMQVWYDHKDEYVSYEQFTQYTKFLRDFVAGLGIRTGKTNDLTTMAEKLLAKIREADQ